MRQRLRQLRIALCAAAVLPLLVLAVAAPLNALRCRLTGQLLTACCCPEQERDQPTSVGAGDCCERAPVDAVRPPAEAPTEALAAVPLVGARPLLAPPHPLLATTRPVPRDGAVPRPPLILAKRSFLI
jgi:hypothetical protein